VADASGRAPAPLPSFPGYDVVTVVGEGALSSVYDARSAPLGRAVAIKSLKASILPESPFAAQFDHEARILGALNHPNIVLLVDFVRTKSQVFLVLEYVDGVTLSELLAARPKLAPESAIAIAAEIARGLAHAHPRGVVHRDVKPSNILVSRRGEVKIIDFGIAEMSATGRERIGESRDARASEASFGTPAYMAPEQILGESVDARSDLFALGVVLYQMLAGVRPFQGRGEGDTRAAAARIRRDPPVPLGRHVPGAPKGLERLVMGLLEKLPDDRPPSALAVAEKLDALAASLARAPLARGDLVRSAMRDAGVAVPPEDDVVDAAPQVPARAAAANVTAAVALPFVAIFVLAVALGGLIQVTGRGARDATGTGDRALELRPQMAGGLRVLATPWAEVVIDGQVVDTTPFARAVPLTAGRHFVTLRHPAANDENREVTIAVGEIVTLDVTMTLTGTARLENQVPESRENGSKSSSSVQEIDR
jgi:eukaryotic-like serine/threonine-protein kinase